MAWWNDRIRIAATLSIAGWMIVLLVGISIIDPQVLPAFWSGWVKWVLGWVMVGAATAATEGLLRIWRRLRHLAAQLRCGDRADFARHRLLGTPFECSLGDTLGRVWLRWNE